MADERQRIDKWLFFARVTKSRSLAAKLAQAGRVRVNGEKIDQASDAVRPGDTLTITLDRQIRVLRVVAPGMRRGPYEEARLLYEDITPPVERGPEALPSALTPVRDAGAGARRSATGGRSTRGPGRTERPFEKSLRGGR